MNPLPTIVLFHGSWHTPANYQSYVNDLQAKGFTVHCPLLPTSKGDRPPKADLPDDVAHVRSVIETCVDRGERVLLIMHSYGGMVGTDAAQGLDLATRRKVNKIGGMQDAWAQMVDIAEDGTSVLRDPGLACFSNLEDESVVKKATETMVCSPPGPLTALTTGDVWRIVPTTYVRTSRDCALVPPYQTLLLDRIKAEGVVLDIVEFDTHHSAWISLPEEMVQMALKAAGDERNLE
ncbi:unnamed protein product [Penicillium bialowiezense]